MIDLQVVREPSLEDIIQHGEGIRIYQPIFVWVRHGNLAILHVTRKRNGTQTNSFTKDMWSLTLGRLMQVAIKSGDGWIYIINSVLILHHSACYIQYVAPGCKYIVHCDVHISGVRDTSALHIHPSLHMGVWDVTSGGVFSRIFTLPLA